MNLSEREQEVMTCVADGLGNKEIGPVLSISTHTVKFHVCNVMQKLGARNRAHAAVMFVLQRAALFAGAALALLMFSCSNDAITYAHLIDPDAECLAESTYHNSEPNTAICRMGGKVWWCRGGHHYLNIRPMCELMSDPAVVERLK